MIFLKNKREYDQRGGYTSGTTDLETYLTP